MMEKTIYKRGLVYGDMEQWSSEVTDDIFSEARSVHSKRPYKVYLLENEEQGMYLAYSNITIDDPCWIISRFNQYKSTKQYNLKSYTQSQEYILEIFTDSVSSGLIRIKLDNNIELEKKLNLLVNTSEQRNEEIVIRVEEAEVLNDYIRIMKSRFDQNRSYKAIISCLDWVGNLGYAVNVTLSNLQVQFCTEDVKLDCNTIKDIYLHIPTDCTSVVIDID